MSQTTSTPLDNARKAPTFQPASNSLTEPYSNIGITNFQLGIGLPPDEPSPNTSLALELQLRFLLAGGLGSNCRRCSEHTAMRLGYAAVVHDYFDDSFMQRRTTLLPICSTCVRAETGIEEKLLAPELDMCRCATMVAKAECPNCVAGEINGALKWETHMRSKKRPAGDVAVATCRCGQEVGEEEKARQCAHCGGVAVAPFFGYAGKEVKFKSGAASPMG